MHTGRTVIIGAAVLGLSLAWAAAQNADPVVPRGDERGRAAKPVRASGQEAGNRALNRDEAGSAQGGAGPAAQAGLGLKIAGDAKNGLVIATVDDDSPAARAGLRGSDRLLSIDGHTIRQPRQVDAYLRSHSGRMIPIVVERDGKQYSFQFAAPNFEHDQAWLGVYLEEADDASGGAQITHVYPAGPAARAGLQAGDTIVKVNDEAIDNPSDLVATIQKLKPRTSAEFTLQRHEQQVVMPVVLGSRDGGASSRAEGQGSSDDRAFAQRSDAFDDVSPYAMQLEHDRRNAEQHQRIEEEIRQLREEIAKLREELKRK